MNQAVESGFWLRCMIYDFPCNFEAGSKCVLGTIGN